METPSKLDLLEKRRLNLNLLHNGLLEYGVNQPQSNGSSTNESTSISMKPEHFESCSSQPESCEEDGLSQWQLSTRPLLPSQFFQWIHVNGIPVTVRPDSLYVHGRETDVYYFSEGRIIEAVDAGKNIVLLLKSGRIVLVTLTLVVLARTQVACPYIASPRFDVGVGLASDKRGTFVSVLVDAYTAVIYEIRLIDSPYEDLNAGYEFKFYTTLSSSAKLLDMTFISISRSSGPDRPEKIFNMDHKSTIETLCVISGSRSGSLKNNSLSIYEIRKGTYNLLKKVRIGTATRIFSLDTSEGDYILFDPENYVLKNSIVATLEGREPGVLLNVGGVRSIPLLSRTECTSVYWIAQSSLYACMYNTTVELRKMAILPPSTALDVTALQLIYGKKHMTVLLLDAAGFLVSCIFDNGGDCLNQEQLCFIRRPSSGFNWNPITKKPFEFGSNDTKLYSISVKSHASTEYLNQCVSSAVNLIYDPDSMLLVVNSYFGSVIYAVENFSGATKPQLRCIELDISTMNILDFGVLTDSLIFLGNNGAIVTTRWPPYTLIEETQVHLKSAHVAWGCAVALTVNSELLFFNGTHEKSCLINLEISLQAAIWVRILARKTIALGLSSGEIIFYGVNSKSTQMIDSQDRVPCEFVELSDGYFIGFFDGYCERRMLSKKTNSYQLDNCPVRFVSRDDDTLIVLSKHLWKLTKTFAVRLSISPTAHISAGCQIGQHTVFLASNEIRLLKIEKEILPCFTDVKPISGLCTIRNPFFLELQNVMGFLSLQDQIVFVDAVDFGELKVNINAKPNLESNFKLVCVCRSLIPMQQFICLVTHSTGCQYVVSIYEVCRLGRTINLGEKSSRAFVCTSSPIFSSRGNCLVYKKAPTELSCLIFEQRNRQVSFFEKVVNTNSSWPPNKIFLIDSNLYLVYTHDLICIHLDLVNKSKCYSFSVELKMCLIFRAFGYDIVMTSDVFKFLTVWIVDAGSGSISNILELDKDNVIEDCQYISSTFSGVVTTLALLDDGSYVEISLNLHENRVCVADEYMFHSSRPTIPLPPCKNG